VAPHSLPFWAERLRSYGVASDQETERFGQPVLPFMDPDGMPVELVATDDALPVKDWAGNPVPADHTLRGFHGATLAVAAAQPSADLLTEHFGFRHVATEGRRYRYVAPGSETGRYLDLLELPGQPRGQLGTGSVHHIAFRVPDDAAQAHWLNRLNSAGYRVTDVQDRQYFRSIYFREPGGVLFEIATDPPGFLADESEAQLGCALRLPPWLEPQRRDIERILPRLDRPGVTAL
jgi:glyoxalase family protein